MTYAATTVTKSIAAAYDDAEEDGPDGTTPNRMMTNFDATNLTISTRVSCFISSAWQDEDFHALSLLALVGVFWLLGQSRRNEGADTSGGF